MLTNSILKSQRNQAFNGKVKRKKIKFKDTTAIFKVAVTCNPKDGMW